MLPEKQPTSNIVVINLPPDHNGSQRELKIKTPPTPSVLEEALQTIEASNIDGLLHKTYAFITQTKQLLLLKGFYGNVPIPSPFILAMILYNSIIVNQYADLPLFQNNFPIFPITIPENYKALLIKNLEQARNAAATSEISVFNTPIQEVDTSNWRTWEDLANFLNGHLAPSGFQIIFSKTVEEDCDYTDRRMPECETYVSSASVQFTFTPPSTPQQVRA